MKRFAMALFAALAMTLGASAGEIAVTGETVVTVTPDTLCLHLSVVTEAEQVKDAVSKNAELVKAVFKAAEDHGVGKKEYATTGYDISPKYTATKEGEARKLAGYAVTNNFSVKVTDLAKGGEVLDALVSAGANRVGRLHFESSKQAEAVRHAKVKAVKDAKAKATELLGPLEECICSVKSVSEVGVYQPRGDSGYEAMSSARATTLVAGDKDVTVRVSVVFNTKSCKKGCCDGDKCEDDKCGKCDECKCCRHCKCYKKGHCPLNDRHKRR